jgi:hypothetical protein
MYYTLYLGRISTIQTCLAFAYSTGHDPDDNTTDVTNDVIERQLMSNETAVVFKGLYSSSLYNLYAAADTGYGLGPFTNLTVRTTSSSGQFYSISSFSSHHFVRSVRTL